MKLLLYFGWINQIMNVNTGGLEFGTAISHFRETLYTNKYISMLNNKFWKQVFMSCPSNTPICMRLAIPTNKELLNLVINCCLQLTAV